MEKMQRTYSHPRSESLWGLGGLEGIVNPGTVCAAQDQQDGQWYRAMVLSKVRGRLYTIRWAAWSPGLLCNVYNFYLLDTWTLRKKRFSLSTV